MSLRFYRLILRESSCAEFLTCKTKALRTAATTVTEKTVHVWIGCAHFSFHRHGKNRMALVQSYLGCSALGGNRVIKHSLNHGQSVTVHHWGAARYSARRQGIASLMS